MSGNWIKKGGWLDKFKKKVVALVSLVLFQLIHCDLASRAQALTKGHISLGSAPFSIEQRHAN